MPGRIFSCFFLKKNSFSMLFFALLAFPMLFFLRIKRTHSKIRFPGLLVASDYMKVFCTVCNCMHQCCGSGSGIRCLLTPGSGISKKLGSGSGMNNPDHISESLETIFWVKVLKFFDADPGSGTEKIRIQDRKNSDPG
jgi:hypothetical protein